MGLDRRPWVNDDSTVVRIGDHPGVGAIQRHWAWVGGTNEVDI
jgi:hypothetical protein